LTVTVAGLGLRVGDHVTPEVERAIRQANEVLVLDAGIATVPWLQRRCERVTTLLHAYRSKAPRLDTYHYVAARVIDSALTHPPVVFATEGHPVVGMHTTTLIRLAAKALEIPVRILPGVSSLAELFSSLAIDPMVAGMQAFEATDLLLRRRPLCPDVPLVLWQIGTLETRLHATGRSRPERFRRLVQHLTRYYPATHPTLLFHASIHPTMRHQSTLLPIGELPDHAAAIHPGHTLFVPPTHILPIADTPLLNAMDDPSHLGFITNT